MAIFGTLTEIPLLELLRTLGRRTGKLSIVLLSQKRDYHLYLDRAKLKAMHVDGQVLRNGQLIRQAFIELSKAKEGNYTFKSIPVEALPKNFDVPLKPLLNTTSTGQIYKNRLPAPQTRFVTSESKQRELESWQSNSLKAFWKSAVVLFDIGSSAEEIAQTLNVDLRTAQLNIYKLRALGQISPLRSFESKFSSNSLKTSPIKKPQKQGDIVSTLVKDMSNLSYKDIIRSLSEEEQQPSSKPPDTIKPLSPQPLLKSQGTIKPLSPQPSNPSHNRKLVSHLLKALKGR